MDKGNQKALVHARVGDRNFEEILVVPFDVFILCARPSLLLRTVREDVVSHNVH